MGNVVPATITSVLSYGAFARLDLGVEGLIHASEMPLAEGQTVKDFLEEGQASTGAGLHVDGHRQRMGLSMQIGWLISRCTDRFSSRRLRTTGWSRSRASICILAAICGMVVGVFLMAVRSYLLLGLWNVTGGLLLTPWSQFLPSGLVGAAICLLAGARAGWASL